MEEEKKKNATDLSMWKCFICSKYVKVKIVGDGEDIPPHFIEDVTDATDPNEFSRQPKVKYLCCDGTYSVNNKHILRVHYMNSHPRTAIAWSSSKHGSNEAAANEKSVSMDTLLKHVLAEAERTFPLEDGKLQEDWTEMRLLLGKRLAVSYHHVTYVNSLTKFPKAGFDQERFFSNMDQRILDNANITSESSTKEKMKRYKDFVRGRLRTYLRHLDDAVRTDEPEGWKDMSLISRRNAVDALFTITNQAHTSPLLQSGARNESFLLELDLQGPVVTGEEAGIEGEEEYMSSTSETSSATGSSTSSMVSGSLISVDPPSDISGEEGTGVIPATHAAPASVDLPRRVSSDGKMATSFSEKESHISELYDSMSPDEKNMIKKFIDRASKESVKLQGVPVEIDDVAAPEMLTFKQKWNVVSKLCLSLSSDDLRFLKESVSLW